MSEKKNIDRLFQEKFRDFEANPAEDLWSGIEARLDEKKRKRVIPLWWKLSGVAAVFLIGLLITQTVFNNDIAPTNPVVIEENTNPNNGKSTVAGSEKDGTNTAVSESNADGIQQKDGDNDSQSGTTVNAVADKSSSGDKKPSTNGQRTSDKINPTAITNDSKSGVAQGNKSNKQRSATNKLDSKGNNPSINESALEKNQNDPLAINKEKGKQTTAEQPIAQTNNDKNKSNTANPLLDKNDINLDGLKGDPNSKIATKEIENKLNDTTKKISVAENSLEELLNEKESKLKQESKLNRWQLTSNVAPIFLGSASNGSPIDSTLAGNSKSYNTGVGFGIGVSYAVNKKLTVRTGLNKFNMSYNTNDIVYYAGIQSRTFNTINPTATGSRIQIENGNAANPVMSENGLLPFEYNFVHKNKGYINQEMGYLEMPVEMTYALLDKKFGIKIIGGFSTLFLQDNTISVVSDNRSTYLGEANNLNDVHFSTNLGIGLKYGFLKSFEFNVEPTFKYQLNTFSSDAGNFKPYVFGIYSGVSYKF
ncbi:hypothetical protein [Flavobacterium terrisoli]|uniref:hypothetical protein n=1 Tax=Flavobacterium terrisoli TaxID=3242195 RepID=UPI00254391E3|nr:hypothetical protein [Flavobacterium buctense]